VSPSLGVTHVAFADESHWNKGKYRALALVTLPVARLGEFNAALLAKLRDSDIREFKWKRLDGAKQRFAALKFCRFVLDEACRNQLRIDTLTWDIEDERHRIRGRDDVANLGRMYYHLFRHVLRERWPDRSGWRLHPDEHTAIDWNGLRHFLSLASIDSRLQGEILEVGKLRLTFKREFGLEEFQPVSSLHHPFVQIADLFAGLATFSRESYERFVLWSCDRSPQQQFWRAEPFRASVSERERFALLAEFNALCKGRKLGVSLKSHRGLRTLNPRNPINFWWYEPQHGQDKAPTKTVK